MRKKCGVPDCNTVAHARGACKKHYTILLKGESIDGFTPSELRQKHDRESTKRVRDDAQNGKLQDLLWEGYKIGQIAEMYGCSHSMVSKLATEHGLERSEKRLRRNQDKGVYYIPPYLQEDDRKLALCSAWR